MLLSVKYLFWKRIEKQFTILHCHHTIFIYNYTPMLEYGLVMPDEEKHRWGFYFSLKDSNTDKLKTSILLSHLNIYIISYKHAFYHTQLLKQRLLEDITCFWTWTTTVMGGRSSLPTPGERSNSDSSGPSSLLWSPWLELGATIIKYHSSDFVPILNLSLSSPSLQAVTDQVTAEFLSKHLPDYFLLFPNEFPE